MSIRDEEIMSLKIGDVFYECEMGVNIEAKVTEQPREEVDADGRRRWEWTAVNTQNGKQISYLLTEGGSHYGPRLYRGPQYAHFKDGALVFPLLGGEA